MRFCHLDESEHRKPPAPDSLPEEAIQDFPNISPKSQYSAICDVGIEIRLPMTLLEPVIDAAFPGDLHKEIQYDRPSAYLDMPIAEIRWTTQLGRSRLILLRHF